MSQFVSREPKVQRQGEHWVVRWGDGVRPASDVEVRLQERVNSLADFIEENCEGVQVYRDIGLVVT